MVEKKLQENSNKIILYHNTSNENAISIHKEGIKGGMRLSAYGKGSEAEGAGVWCTTIRGYGYGGATITFEVDMGDKDLAKQNDTEYIIYRDIKPEEIIDIDLMVSSISSISGHTGTVESDIPNVIKKFGKDKLLQVFKNNDSKFVSPYNYDIFINLIETGNKLLKGTISLTESKKIEENLKDQYVYVKSFVNAIPDRYSKNHKVTDINYATTKKGEPKLEFTVDGNKVLILEYPPNKDKRKYYCYINGGRYGYIPSATHILDKLTEGKKLTEASRNELLVKAKAETITRYNKSAGYKGFGLVDIDTTAIKTRDAIIITNKVGNYYDTIELEDILYWVGLIVEESKDKKMGIKVAEKALLGAIDGMDIKIDCNCR